MDVLFLPGLDPCRNLATEDYLLHDLARTQDILLLWRNLHTIVVGRHQLTLQEVNSDYVRTHGITVVRRITGGGAVYHDLGNVNFSFITSAGNATAVTLEHFTRPMAEALRSMGLDAETTGRNDIAVDDRKVSGNAQRLFKNRILHHGTLLFDADLTVLGKALNVHPAKLRSKGVRSVESRVTNILPCLSEPMTVEAFMARIGEALTAGQDVRPLKLTTMDENNIANLCASKYSTHEWNVGHAPAASAVNTRKFDGGLLEVRMDIVNGKLANCSFNGDFMAMLDVESFAAQLNGLPYDRDAVSAVLYGMDTTPYFGGITPDELLEILFELTDEPLMGGSAG